MNVNKAGPVSDKQWPMFCIHIVSQATDIT